MSESRDEIVALFDRIAAGTHTDADLAALRRVLSLSGDRNLVQAGKYNIQIAEGQDIQIGDTIYRGATAGTVRKVLRELLQEFLGPPRPQADLAAIEARYCSDVIRKYGRLEFSGLKADDLRLAEVFLQDVFVGLSLSAWRSAAWSGSRAGEEPAGDQNRELETRQEEAAGARSSETMGTGGQGQKQGRERRPARTTPSWEPITLAEVLSQNSFIIGEPGAGKSTLLRWLAVTHAGKVGREGDGSVVLPVTDQLPVYVELGRLSRQFLDPDEQIEPNWQMLPRYVADQPEMNEVSAACIADAVSHGRCLLLFDGLDEVTDRVVRARLIRSIDRQFGGDNRIIIASRPSGLADVESAAPGGFQRCRIKRFTDEDIKRFIQNRYRLLEDLTENEKQARADAFFDALRRSAGAMDLARTPLLAAILLRLQEDQGALPKEPIEIYERCCESLIKDWQLYRPSGYTGVFKDLSWERHLGLLAPLAYAIYAVSGRGSAPSNELAPPLSRALLAQGLTTVDVQAQLEAERFLAALGLGSGLLQRQGENEYGFPHQTFQEYLVARYIAFQEDPNVTVDLVMEHLHEARWTQIHELVIGILCSRDATVEKAELLVRRILRVYPLPWRLLRPDHLDPGKLIPGFQLDRRLAYVLGREAELAARGCGAAVLNEKADRIRYEVEIACLDGLLRRQGQEPFARALGRLGVANRLVYDVLLLRLRSDDPDVVEAAARSLGQLGMVTNEARDRLLETLNGRYEEEEAQAAAARSLGDWGLADPEIVDALIRAADQRHREMLKQSSVASLVHLAGSDPTVKDAIVEVLRGQLTYKRTALIPGLGELERADPDIVQSLISALGRPGREAAVESLVRLGKRDAQVAKALLQPLRSNDVSMYRAAAEALGRLGQTNPAVAEMLLGVLGNHYCDVTQGAFSVLVEITNEMPEVADRLLAAFLRDNSRVRLAAVQILSRLSPAPPWAAEVLIQALREDTDFAVRELAAWTLGEAEHASQEMIRALLWACSDGYNTVRAAAIRSLGQLHSVDGEALDVMIAALTGDDYANVQAAAATSLGMLALPSTKAVDALVRALSDRERTCYEAPYSALSSFASRQVGASDVREAAAYSLGHLGLAGPEVLVALIDALGWKGETYYSSDREAAAWSLGWLKRADKDVIDALVRALDDECSEVREAAAGSLGLIGSATPTVIDALLTVLNDSRGFKSSRAAAISLGNLGICNSAILAGLLAAIDEDRGNEWQSAICSLVKLGSSRGEVRKLLLDRVAYGEERPSGHFTAALCLFMLGHRPSEIIDILVRGTNFLLDNGHSLVAARQVFELGQTDDYVVETLIEALIHRLVGVADYPSFRDDTASCLDELAEKIRKTSTSASPTWLPRWAAIHVATQRDSAPLDMLAIWKDALNDAAWCVRWEAATALGSLDQSESDGIAELERRLYDNEVLVRYAAVISLGRRGRASQGAVEAIGGLLSHRDAQMRLAAAKSLAALGCDYSGVILLLLQSLQGDTYSEVRAAAADSLGRLAPRDPQVVEALRRVLANIGEVAGVRAAAAESLGRTGASSREVATELFGALGDENTWISRSAGLALASLGHAEMGIVNELVALMGSENPCLRRGAAWGLRWLVRETPAVVSTLLQAARDPDGAIRHSTLLGLGSLDEVGTDVLQALIHGLGDNERPVRDAALGALVRLGKTDLTIVDALFDALGCAQADIREAICRSFGMLGTSAPWEVAHALRAALHDSSESVRYAAAESLGLLGRADNETIAELLRFLSNPERKADGTSSWHLRRVAARSLARISYFKTEIVHELLDEFESAKYDEDRRESAIVDLVALAKASPEAVRALHEALDTSNQSVRRGAGRCLAELGYTTSAIVRDLIEDALQHRVGSREPLHKRVVDSLVQLGRADSEITEQIIRAFAKKHNNDYAGMLTGILGQIGYRQPAAVTALLRAAHDPDRNRPQWVIEALGQVGQGSTEIIVTLTERLRDPEWDVRQAAARSLGQLNINVEVQLRYALIALNRALHDEDEDVRRDALVSIRKLLNGRPIPGYCWKPITAKREQQD